MFLCLLHATIMWSFMLLFYNGYTLLLKSPLSPWNLLVPSYIVSCHNCGHGSDLRGCPQSPLSIEGMNKFYQLLYLQCPFVFLIQFIWLLHGFQMSWYMPCSTLHWTEYNHSSHLEPCSALSLTAEKCSYDVSSLGLLLWMKPYMVGSLHISKAHKKIRLKLNNLLDLKSCHYAPHAFWHGMYEHLCSLRLPISCFWGHAFSSQATPRTAALRMQFTK